MNNETVTIELIRKFLRAFCISFDSTLGKLRSEGKFYQLALAPMLGKVDPYNIDNFACNLKWLKPEKMQEISVNIYPKVMLELKSNSIDIRDSVQVSSAFTKYLTRYAFENIQAKSEGDDVAYTSLFTHFALKFSKSDIENLNLQGDEYKILKDFKEKCSGGPLTEDDVRDVCSNPKLGSILNRERLCISIMDFTLSCEKVFMGIKMEYLLDWSGDFVVKSREDIYKSIYFWENNFKSNTRLKVDEYIPIEEVPLNLIDLNYQH